MTSVLPPCGSQRISTPPDARCAIFADTTAGPASSARAALLPIRWCRTLPGSWGAVWTVAVKTWFAAPTRINPGSPTLERFVHTSQHLDQENTSVTSAASIPHLGTRGRGRLIVMRLAATVVLALVASLRAVTGANSAPRLSDR